jgi:hypothetical protein
MLDHVAVRTSRLACCGAALALLVTACGSSTQTATTTAVAGPPAVEVTILAPTSGVTVNTRTIDVIGRVFPTNAKVSVAGSRVRVSGGSFQLPMNLAGDVARIGVRAWAHGYRPWGETLTVRYASAKSGPQTAGGSAATNNGGNSPGVTTACEEHNAIVDKLQTNSPLNQVSNAITAANADSQLLSQLQQQSSSLTSDWTNIVVLQKKIAAAMSEGQLTEAASVTGLENDATRIAEQDAASDRLTACAQAAATASG